MTVWNSGSCVWNIVLTYVSELRTVLKLCYVCQFCSHVIADLVTNRSTHRSHWGDVCVCVCIFPILAISLESLNGILKCLQYRKKLHNCSVYSSHIKVPSVWHTISFHLTVNCFYFGFPVTQFHISSWRSSLYAINQDKEMKSPKM